MADEKSLNSNKSHIEWGGSYEKFKFIALKIEWGKKAFNSKKNTLKILKVKLQFLSVGTPEFTRIVLLHVFTWTN